jgi:hypothetical protein
VRVGDRLMIAEVLQEADDEGWCLPPVKPLSRVHKRLLTMSLFEEGEGASIVYQHSVFCQTCLPYRDPGKDIRLL